MEPQQEKQRQKDNDNDNNNDNNNNNNNNDDDDMSNNIYRLLRSWSAGFFGVSAAKAKRKKE